MDRGRGDDGSVSDLPWTAVFDPVANARALSAIQAEGFRAAAKLVDRFVEAAATTGNGSGPASEPAAGQATSDPPSIAGADLIVGSWWSFWGRLLRSLPSEASASSGRFELSAPEADGGVELTAEGSDRVTAEVWLHNSGGEDLGPVRLLCSGLVSHDGASISADEVHFYPAQVPMPGRSSRGISVEVTVPDGQPAGRYRGLLLAQGFPDLWLPVVLTVTAPH